VIRLLDRMVAWQFLKLFGISVLFTPPLFVLGELTEQLNRYTDMELTGAEIARGYLYRIPEYVVWAFPFAGLIAAIFTVHSLTSHREIVAAKAGGISFHRLVLPILLCGTLLTGVALGLTEIVPRTNRVANQILRKVDLRAEWRSDFVYRTESGFTLSATHMTMLDSRISGVDLMQERQHEDGPGALVVHAQEAEHSAETGWTLLNGMLWFAHPDGRGDAYRFERLHLPVLTEKPEELLDEPPQDDEMTYAELGRMARVVERSGGKAERLLVKQGQRVAIPVATLIIVLFGVPLATSSKRGGTAYGVGAALGTTILFVLLMKVAGSFGESGSIPPEVASWSPDALFLLAGLALLAKVRT
jgi:lipopolysaccharide export system permease protein